jgi:5-methylcytosine-specific restriction endonuclease McrA
MQTKMGATKKAAKKLGISVDEYIAHQSNGEKWCNRCQAWRPQELFKPGKYKCTWSLTGQRYKNSELTRQRMSEARKGRPSKRRGVKHTIQTRAKISSTVRERTPRGNQCHSYKDGKLAERRGLRFSPEYKQWRYDVFLRDRFTCQQCGDNRGGNLVAHHLKPFADFPELRFEVSNGLTLCEACHKRLHYPINHDNSGKARQHGTTH